MSTFKVGNTTIGDSPLINEEVKEQLKQEEQLLQEVTEQTFKPIERTSEQEAAIAEVKNAITLTDENLVLSYGVEDANALMNLTNKALSHVRASDVGDIGNVLATLATDLSVGEIEDQKGFFGFFKKMGDRAKALQIRYESAQANIDRVVATLESNQLTLIKNNRDMEDMKQANRENFQRLSVYVEAGKQRIADAYAIELPAREEKAKKGTQTEVNELTEFKNALNLFEKQVHDLDAQMSLSQGMAIQLETLSNTNRGLIQKIQRSKGTLIPAWNLYMMTAFYGQQTKNALEADKKFTDATNELLVNVTKGLRQTAKDAAEQSERASIDITTLESMTADIIGSLQDIDAAQAKGREYREKATQRIGELRDQIKLQLTTTINNQGQ